jgi:hypothetical protein
MMSIVRKSVFFMGLLTFVLLVYGPARAKSPYLPDGQILWSSEVDFVEAGGTPVSHGDILEDLETYSGEGASILPGGGNAQLIAAFFGANPEAPPPLPQKGLDGFDVITLQEPNVPWLFSSSLTLGLLPRVFFTTEANIELADGLAPPWNLVPPIREGDLLTNCGVVIPNYFLLEPFDLYRDPGLTLPVWTIYEWNASNTISIGLDAVDVENVDSGRFDALTTLIFNSQAQTQGRLNEVNIGAMTFEFWIFFSFEESGAGNVDPPHYTYTQQRYYLGPLHRIADPITGARLPVGTEVSDDDLLMVYLPYLRWRQAPMLSPLHCAVLLVRAGRDNLPALGGGDLANLFRDTNKATETSPLGLDAVDVPRMYDFVVNPALAAHFMGNTFSDEFGETGAVTMADPLLGYDPFGMVLFSTSATDPNGRRTLDAGESTDILPGALFPFARQGIDECDVLGSDSYPLFAAGAPDGAFRGIELVERMMGDGTGAALPGPQHAGLDGLDVIPAQEQPEPTPTPTPPPIQWKDANGPDPNGYMPDFDQKQNGWHDLGGHWTFCGPVAEANSLWWYDLTYPEVVGSVTPAQLVNDLAARMQCLPQTGTDIRNMYDGIDSYLLDNLLAGLLEVHFIPQEASEAVPPTEPVLPPPWADIVQEVTRCQDVVMLLGFWVVDSTSPIAGGYEIQWHRSGGHYVTAAGVSAVTDYHLAISDPYFDAYYSGLIIQGATRGENHNVPNGHNDGISASHDIYQVTDLHRSPGGWVELLGYPANAGALMNFEMANGGLRFAATFWPLVWGPPPDVGDIFTEIEGAVAVSIIETDIDSWMRF